MINLRKCLSFSVFAIFALAVFCLAFGQVAEAKVSGIESSNTEGINDLYQTGVPLPGLDRDRTGGAAAVVTPDGPELNEGPLPLTEINPVGIRDLINSKRGGAGINPKTGGEDVGTATVIPSVPYTDLGSTLGALDDYNEECPYTPTGAPDVVYSYTPVGNESVDLSLCNSAYDTKMYVYENAVTPGAPFACNDDSCPGFMSEILGLNLTGGNTYYIVVDGYDAASFGDYQLDVTVFVPPWACQLGDQVEGEPCGTEINDGCFGGFAGAVPFITPGTPVCGTSWHSGTARDADFFRYDVVTSGEVVVWTGTAEFEFALLIYQPSPGPAAPCGFLGGGAWVAGTAASTQLFLPTGTYYFRVAMNSFAGGGDCGTGPGPGGDWRWRATLTTTPVTPIDDCEAPGTMVTGLNNFDLTGFTGGGGSYGGFIPNGWYAWTATCSGLADFTMCNTMLDPNNNDFQISVWDACESAGGTEIGYGEDDCNSWAPEITGLLVNAGTTYIIEVATWAPYYNPAAVTGVLEIACTPIVMGLEDDCAQALVRGEIPAYEFLSTEGASTDGPQDICDIGHDIWVIYTASCAGEALVSTCGPVEFDSRIAAYDGPLCLNVDPRDPIACNDDGPGFGQTEGCGNFGSSMEFVVVPGGEYLIRLGGYRATAGQDPAEEGLMSLQIVCNTSPPVRPANDQCQDILPLTVIAAPGIGNTATESQLWDNTNSTNRSCLGLPEGTWQGFSAGFCFDLKADRCGTTAAGSNVGGGAYTTLHKLWSACPCQDGVSYAGDNVFSGCPDGPDIAETGASNFYFGLLPGDYYYFIGAIGKFGGSFEDGPYQVNFRLTEVECAHCIAQSSAGLCPAGNEHITNVTVGTFANASGCDGYADYVGVLPGIPVYRGLTYPVTVATGGNFGAPVLKGDVIGVWVDWGQDFDYLTAGDEVYQGGLNVPTASFNLTIPFSAALPGGGFAGNTRLRFRVVKTGDDPFGPCGDVLWGETEDYELILSDLICGDFDGSGAPDAGDVTFLMDYYFSNGSAPDPVDQGDINADCCINIADIIALADNVYRGAADPVCIPCM